VRRNIHVYLGAKTRLVGTLRYDAQGARESAAFEYDATWLMASERFAIDPALVVGRNVHAHSE
jgi:serine/threonine-protein kinase HipA